MSKMIILSHVKEGYDMAKQHKLPAIIQDIILQHHGSSLLSLFFEKEKLEHGENYNSDAEFRYPGPLPKSKEAGIVMLADSIEATIRSLNKPSPEKIDATIQKIFKDKLDDKQLDECPLTFDDINKIRQVFLNFFKGVHHNRLDYQKEFDKLTTSDDSKKNQKFHDSK
jgi:membrane-associated HD superfamily phosphohydrolase